MRLSLGLIFAAALAPAAAQDGGAARDPAIPALLAKVAPAIVPVRMVLKIGMPGMEGSEREMRGNGVGTIVDPSGLVLLGAPRVNVNRGGRGGRGRGPGGPMPEPTVTPVSFNVTLPGEEKEREAFLVARDGDLSAMFLQLEGLGDRKLAALDLRAGATPAVGDTVYLVSRLGKPFDHAPFAQLGWITGEIAKPRKAWAINGSIGQVGLPMFTRAGEPAGLFTNLTTGDEDGDGAADGEARAMGTFLVPCKTLAPVIDQAKQKAAELLKERAAKPPEPTPPVDPAPPKKEGF